MTCKPSAVIVYGSNVSDSERHRMYTGTHMIVCLTLGGFFVMGIAMPESPLVAMVPCILAAVLTLSIGMASLIGTIRHLDDLVMEKLSEEELSYLKNIVAKDLI
ncbi:MAG: hypothetical protein ACOC38_09005 [Promethearchaeia archaeon]